MPEAAEILVLCFGPNALVLQQQDSTWSIRVLLRFHFGSAFLFGVCIYCLELDIGLDTICNSFSACVALYKLFVFIVLL